MTKAMGKSRTQSESAYLDILRKMTGEKRPGQRLNSTKSLSISAGKIY